MRGGRRKEGREEGRRSERSFFRSTHTKYGSNEHTHTQRERESKADPTIVGITRGTQSVTTLVVLSDEGRNLGCSKVFMSLIWHRERRGGC